MQMSKAAEAVIQYYARTRAIGHTHAMLHGALSTNATILMAHHGQLHAFRSIHPQCRGQLLTLDNVAWGYLDGIRAPLVMDHYTITTMLTGLLEENAELRAVIVRQEELLNVHL